MATKKADDLKKELFYNSSNAAEVLKDAEIKKADKFCEDYKKFLDSSKTEREAVKSVIAIAEKNGYKKYDDSKKYKAGDKFYYVNRNKSIILTVMGKKSLKEGVKISAAHIDSPRLDLKPNPLYEKDELALFKTHYYGGIKKYQWVTIPLALHGVVVKKDGSEQVTTNLSMYQQPQGKEVGMLQVLLNGGIQQQIPVYKAITPKVEEPSWFDKLINWFTGAVNI